MIAKKKLDAITQRADGSSVDIKYSDEHRKRPELRVTTDLSPSPSDGRANSVACGTTPAATDAITPPMLRLDEENTRARRAHDTRRHRNSRRDRRDPAI